MVLGCAEDYASGGFSFNLNNAIGGAGMPEVMSGGTVAPSFDNTITIYLDGGIYSPSTTGEVFSIQMISNVNLIGEGEELTILDAEQTGRVIAFNNCENNVISDITLSNGRIGGDYPDNAGGGMHIINSSPSMINLTVNGSRADYGGGIYIRNSSSILSNITLLDNIANYFGGGVFFSQANPSLNNILISNNISYSHGGEYISLTQIQYCPKL